MKKRKVVISQAVGQIIHFGQDGEFYFKKGMKYYRRRELFKAKKYFQRAVQCKPKDALFLCQLAITLTELGQYEDSNKLFIQIIKDVEPDMHECYSFLANNYAHLGLFQEAKKYATLYLEHAPDGEFYEDIEDLLDFLSMEWNELVGFDDEEDELIMLQESARKLLENGKIEEASVMLQNIVKDYPTYWSAYNNLSLAQFYLGHVTKAIQLAQEVLKGNEGNLHAYCNLAIYYHYLERNHEVAQIVTQLKKIYPIDLDNRSKLGVTFALLGHYEDAFFWLKWLYKYGYQGDQSFYYWLAVSAYYTDRHQFAKEMWETLVQLDPAKKGEEPWRKVPIQGKKSATSTFILQQFKEMDSEEEKCLLVLLLKKAENKKALKKIGELVREQNESAVLRDLVNYILNKQVDENASLHFRLQSFFDVFDELSKDCAYSPEMEHAFYLLLLRIWIHTYDQPIHFKNARAWAAAIEYCSLQAENMNVIQKQVAKKYEISTSTLRKYAKDVKNLCNMINKSSSF